MTKLPGWGHQGRGISGLWGLLHIFLSFTFLLSSFSLPPPHKQLQLRKQNWQSRLFVYFAFPLIVSRRKILCIGLQLSYCSLLPSCVHPTSLSKVETFQRELCRVNCLLMDIVLWGPLWQPCTLPYPFTKTCVFSWALAWEAEGRSQKGCMTDPEQAVIQGNKNLVSLHLFKLGNFLKWPT